MQSGLHTVDAASGAQKSLHRFVLPCMFFICAESDWRDYINSLEQELNTLVRNPGPEIAQVAVVNYFGTGRLC